MATCFVTYMVYVLVAVLLQHGKTLLKDVRLERNTIWIMRVGRRRDYWTTGGCGSSGCLVLL